MINFLFQGLLDLLKGVVSGFLLTIAGAFNVDVDTFLTIFPVMVPIHACFETIGWAFLIILFVFNIIRSMMTPNDQQAEHPLRILCMAAVGAFLLIFNGQILDMCLKSGHLVYDAFNSMGGTAMPAGDVLNGSIETMAGVGAGALTAGVTTLVSLVLLGYLFYEIVKYILECLSRYVTLHFGVWMMPLFAPMVVSKATSSIFSSYVNFMCGQMILLWLSSVGMTVIISGFNSLNNFFAYFVMIAMLKLLQQMDNLMNKLGFKTLRQTGAGIAAGLVGAGFLASRLIGGKGGGGGARGGGGALSGAWNKYQALNRSARGAVGAGVDKLTGGKLSEASAAISRRAADINGAFQNNVIGKYGGQKALDLWNGTTSGNGSAKPASDSSTTGGNPSSTPDDKIPPMEGAVENPVNNVVAVPPDTSEEAADNAANDATPPPEPPKEAAPAPVETTPIPTPPADTGDTTAYGGAVAMVARAGEVFRSGSGSEVIANRREAKKILGQAAATYATEIREGRALGVPADSPLQINYGTGGWTYTDPVSGGTVSGAFNSYSVLNNDQLATVYNDAQHAADIYEAEGVRLMNTTPESVGMTVEQRDSVVAAYNNLAAGERKNAEAANFTIMGQHEEAVRARESARNSFRASGENFHKAGITSHSTVYPGTQKSVIPPAMKVHGSAGREQFNYESRSGKGIRVGGQPIVMRAGGWTNTSNGTPEGLAMKNG